MHFSTSTSTLAALGALISVSQAAAPTFTTPGPQVFLNASCSLSKTLTPGQPLATTLPPINFLAKMVTPRLQAILGTNTISDIDAELEVNCDRALQDVNAGDGLCQDLQQAIIDFVNANEGQAQADKYKCLLDALCLVNPGFNHDGTCQTLLAGEDCIEFLLVSPEDVECPSTT